MPLYTIDTQKSQLGEYWTNRYVVQAASLDDADVLAADALAREAAFHTTNVLIEKSRTRLLAPGGGDAYIIRPYNFNGGYDGGAIGSQLPLFNVVRVDLAVSMGRPSRKYYRTGLTEAMVDGSALAEAYIDVVETGVENLRLDWGVAFVDVDDQPIIGFSVIPQVAMRQLRRGSRRRTEPII